MTTPIKSRQVLDLLSYNSTVMTVGSITNSSTIAIYDNNNSSSQFNLTYTNNSSNLSLSSNLNNVKTNMNLGINKSNPSYTLDVNGDINTSGNMYLGNTLVFDSNLNFNSNINISYSSITSISANNIGYKNRIINGDMRIDSLNSLNNPITISSSRYAGRT